MCNSEIIYQNNLAVDCLHAGDVENGLKILSRAFFDSVRDRHQRHNLSVAGETSLEFSLQDCSCNLRRALDRQATSSWTGGDDSSQQYLSLNFLRMDFPASSQQGIDQLCSCAVTWAVAYNLSIVYALVGFLRGANSKTGGRALFKKAMHILLPIKKQVLMQQSTSPFWTNVKLSILNNYICMLRECGTMDIASSVQSMEELLARSRSHLDPVDVKNFYLSMQFLNVCSSAAPAA